MFQLVIQFTGDWDPGRLAALEDRLAAKLEELGDVDGHDCGADESNVFIFTSDPVAAWDRVRAALRKTELAVARAAYRSTKAQKYKTLWPANLKSFKVT